MLRSEIQLNLKKEKIIRLDENSPKEKLPSDYRKILKLTALEIYVIGIRILPFEKGI
ncbi:MAG: hypothetical protein IPL26_12405 [Leptospiraceae bacterium]|nr:hypothetical protein [Leptospiraceae bacterium]